MKQKKQEVLRENKVHRKNVACFGFIHQRKTQHSLPYKFGDIGA